MALNKINPHRTSLKSLDPAEEGSNACIGESRSGRRVVLVQFIGFPDP
jgi:hypothetical protein